MHLAYSAIATNYYQPINTEPENTETEIMLRYQAYQATCEKHRHEIAAIQKYIPGWLPKFR